jgi:hypothetical protein
VLITSLWRSLEPQASSLSGTTDPNRRPTDYEYICLTLQREKTYNTCDAEVAQVVEQRTENPRVSSSTLLLGTIYERAEDDQISSAAPCDEGRRNFQGKRAEVAER